LVYYFNEIILTRKSQLISEFGESLKKKVKKSAKSFGSNEIVSIFAIPKRWGTEKKKAQIAKSSLTY